MNVSQLIILSVFTAFFGTYYLIKIAGGVMLKNILYKLIQYTPEYDNCYYKDECCDNCIHSDGVCWYHKIDKILEALDG